MLEDLIVHLNLNSLNWNNKNLSWHYFPIQYLVSIVKKECICIVMYLKRM